MSGWKKDLRSGALALSALLLSMLPWILFGAVCVHGQEYRQTAAAQPLPEGPYVALTFDDGPRRSTTTALLDGLAQRGAHATFFLVGINVEGNEDLILRMEEEGHQVGIHSQNHKMLTELNGAGVAAEVVPLRHTLSALLGREKLMVRPPYGMTNRTIRGQMNAPIILWSIDPEDWSDENSERQTALIVSKAADGDIILLHDIYPSSVETALRVVDELMEKGFHFVTVEELFLIRGQEPTEGKVYRCLPP